MTWRPFFPRWRRQPAPQRNDIDALLEHLQGALASKFPTQPKPSVEWWARLRALVEVMAPTDPTTPKD